MATGLEQQALIIIKALEGRKIGRDSPIFKKGLEWIGRWPISIDERLKRRLVEAFCQTFEIQEAQIYAMLEGEELPLARRSTLGSEEDRLYRLLPEGSWLKLWADYTRETEPPLSYHLFCSLGVIGAALGRKVWIDWGPYQIWPSYCVILIGPTGRVKKTTAIDIAKNLIADKALCPIMADKITSESLASSLVKNGGWQLIYAPELSVFFGRQRYNEGLTTTILRLLDCPPSYTVSTQSRGEEEISKPTLTVLGGSTLSLLSSSTPQEVLSSGFLNRFILVVENDTSRIFPRPHLGSRALIEAKLSPLSTYEGEITYSHSAYGWYERWYRQKREHLVGDEMTAEILERAHVHLNRTAMLLHLVDCGLSPICLECMELSGELIAYVEKRVPDTVRAINKTTISQDVDYVVQTLERLGGAADHSTLLRRVGNRLDRVQLKKHIENLEEQGRVKVGKKGLATYYILRGSSDANN